MLTDVSEVYTASVMRTLIALVMEAVFASETSVSIYLTTWQYIPEDYKLHTRHHENLKSHILNLYGRLFYVAFNDSYPFGSHSSPC
jgi:hypothetical protein